MPTLNGFIRRVGCGFRSVDKDYMCVCCEAVQGRSFGRCYDVRIPLDTRMGCGLTQGLEWKITNSEESIVRMQAKRRDGDGI